ncbi:MAG: glycosyl hydrolase-related protein, partial [Rhodothermales bacterium]
PNWAYLEGAFVWGVYGGYTNMESRITNLLNKLANDGYPYDFVLINAATGDNGPPKTNIVNNVQAWNDNHPGTTMRVATFGDFFYHAEFESGARDSIPVIAGDAPNWWSLWFASSATKGHLLSRKAQALLPAAETAASIASVVDASYNYPDEALARAYNDNLLYEDHNMGYKTTDPAPNEEFWELKMGWVTNALSTAEEVFDAGIQSWAAQITTAGALEIAVFNVLPWTRSGVVTIPADDPLLADVRAFEIVDNGSGAVIPHQRLSTGEVAFRADSVPSLGYKTFRIAENSGPITGPTPLTGNVLENGDYRVEIGETGGALSVLDKELGREWSVGGGRFNEYRYSGSGAPMLAVASSDSGEVLQRIFLEGEAPGSSSYRTEVVLPAGLKRIDFFNTYNKNPPAGSETVDFFFDFDAPTASLRYEIPFGSVRLFEDELSGFRIKHYESQRWTTVSDELGTAVLSSSGPGLEAYSSGSFNGTVRFLTSWDNEGSYRAGTGPLNAGFSVTSHAGPADPALATRSGYNFSVPLHARLLPRNQTGTLDSNEYSFVDVRGATLQLSTLKRWNAGDGLIARFYNPSPEPVDVDLEISGVDPYVYEANLLEGVMVLTKRGGSVRVSFGPYEVKTLLLGVYFPNAVDEDHPETLEPLLDRPYPNPFVEGINFSYSVPSPSAVRLVVHDVLGRVVSTVVDSQVGPGRHESRWNGRDAGNVEVAAGVYIVSLETKDSSGSSSRVSTTVVKAR